VYGLNNEWIADRLKLAPEQRKLAAEIRKKLRERMREASRGLGNLSPEEQRAKIEEFGRKSLAIRDAANQEALGLLTAGQKEEFCKLLGEKTERPSRHDP
jgi:hypothetical protein